MSDLEENQEEKRDVGQPSLAPSVTVRPPSAETLWTELLVAVNYLTRFNFKLSEEPKPRLIRKSMAWFPLIGALIGFAGAAIDWIMSMLGMPGLITASFAVIGMLWITRALHEEEFASLANKWGQVLGQDQKTKWLSEERSVRYGTLGVIILIIMKIGAIASLGSNDAVFQSLVAACCWSRAMMVLAAGWLRPLEGDPVASYFQQPFALRIVMALAMGALINFGMLESYAVYTLSVGTAVGILVALVGAHHLRGYNGQLLGTLQQIVEISVLGTILALQ